MNNEPVAWRCKKFYETQEGWFYNENEIGEPLYTHLVKELDEDFDAICLENKRLQAEIERLTMLCDCMTTESNRKGNEIEALKAHPVKDLTDEEIEAEWFKVFKPETGIGKNLTNGVYEFARAILRKAQGK